jgi:hypothetical protein
MQPACISFLVGRLKYMTLWYREANMDRVTCIVTVFVIIEISHCYRHVIELTSRCTREWDFSMAILPILTLLHRSNILNE